MELKQKNFKIYIISGKAGTGKNMVASLITDYYNDKKVVTISYAFYLKEYAKRILNWDGKEETKPRDFLQQIGVELIKNNIDKEMLVRRVIEDIKVYSYFYDIIIIDDARFIEEIENIKNNFNSVISINILSISNRNKLTDLQKKHASEVSLDNYNKFDYIVNNDSDLNKLKEEIQEIVSEVENNE